ncbi:MAG: CocE/NonD family hydrolase C-terminal non-catalytic domain-containing protein, partial [Haloarculaceae archaeon]
MRLAALSRAPVGSVFRDCPVGPGRVRGPFQQPRAHLVGAFDEVVVVGPVALEADQPLAARPRLFHLVAQGRIRAGHRDDLASHDPLEPGIEYELEVPLQPRSHLFEAGHSVRVAVAAAYFPEYMPVGDHGSFDLRSSADRPLVVRLPGRSRADADYEQTTHMGAPTTDRSTEPERVTDRSVSWETTRERTADVARVTIESSLPVDLPHADYTETGTFEPEVAADNPSSSGATTRFEISIPRPEEEIEVLARNNLTRTLIQMTTRVEVDGETYFEQRWTARVRTGPGWPS